PQMLGNVVDRSMQVFGAMGLTPDTPLADLWIAARALRIADGPDEVHLRSIARLELEGASERRGASSAYLTPAEVLHTTSRR
ncbi:acyl-CoA dehydrogenase family protein, partial [Pseudomonas sp.]|uniref:acyl-CoA dehydrogenase family protein n=1 Tax=Pseudomonas sp. TaxID=306 RepID=UPI00272AE54C